MNKMAAAVSVAFTWSDGNGFMRREDRKVPCGFREPPKGNSSRRNFGKGRYHQEGLKVGR